MFKQRQQPARQIVRVGRRASLVVHDAQRILLLRESQNRFDKIFAAQPIQPSRADNQPARWVENRLRLPLAEPRRMLDVLREEGVY